MNNFEGGMPFAPDITSLDLLNFYVRHDGNYRLYALEVFQTVKNYGWKYRLVTEHARPLTVFTRQGYVTNVPSRTITKFLYEYPQGGYGEIALTGSMVSEFLELMGFANGGE